MSLRRVGPYEVTGKLGEGGMGEVYRAVDSRLRREVAIKVLPAGFTADAERLARFEREAQLLAQLHHPHIASIFGLEESDGVRALVMELVEGPTLADRLAGGPLPVEEALQIARQIAEALEEAHEKGIVHRDLKPQNVKVRADGTVKVLDFGLAKAMDRADAAEAPALANSPTMMNSPTLPRPRSTELGVILGTAAYMAPEQAKGQRVDERADVWAFGVVLHEMLTGRPLFGGDSATEILAAVLRQEIALSTLPADTPPAIRRLLRRCLERNPRNRLHAIADARLVLDEVLAGRGDEDGAGLPAALTAPLAPAYRPAWRRALPWATGLLLGALGAATADRTVLAPPPLEPPQLVSLTYTGKDRAPLASPDGKTVAFLSTRDGRSRVWLHQLATGDEVAITDGPNDIPMAFSPDGSSLLVLRGRTAPFALFSVSSVGGGPRHVADGVASSATWAPDGSRIAFNRVGGRGGLPDTIVTVAPEGGDERVLARVNDLMLLSVLWSPDGRTIAAYGQLPNFAARQRVIGFDARTGARRDLYGPPPGSLVYGWTWSGPDALVVGESTTQAGNGGMLLRRIPFHGRPTTLVALRQQAGSIDVAGPDRLVIDQVAPVQNLGEWPLAGPGPAAPSSDAPGRWLTRGTSVDRQPVYAPDGKRLVFNSDRGGNLDLWELELATGTLRRLTVERSDDWDPAFTPDGKHILWSSNRTGNFEVWMADADGSGPRQVSHDGVDAENPTMTRDGWVVYVSANPAKRGVWKVRADGSGAQRLFDGTANIAEVSPDAGWAAFIDGDRARLRVIAVADGSEVWSAPLNGANFVTLLQIGRSRWLPRSRTLAWLDYDAESDTWSVVAQEIAPGRDTAASRRVLLAGDRDAAPESFAVAPDGVHLVASVVQTRTEIVLVQGLHGLRG